MRASLTSAHDDPRPPVRPLYEDFEPGDVYRHWPGKTITEADDHLFCMITMNHHPLHIDAWYAETQTQFGKNVVVGNLVYSLVLGMSVPDVSGAAIANLEVESLQHKRPTFHGDTIYAETNVLEKRESSSRPDRGVVTVETRGFNQRGRRGLLLPAQGDGAQAGRGAAAWSAPTRRPPTSRSRRWRPAVSSARSWRGRRRPTSCSTRPTSSRSSTTGRSSRATPSSCPRPHVETLRDLDDPPRDDLFARTQQLAAAVQDATALGRLVRGHEQRRQPERPASPCARRPPQPQGRPARLLLAPAAATPTTPRRAGTPSADPGCSRRNDVIV